MSMALQELKLLLLSKTVDTFDKVEQSRSVVNALQSLLKVAEMRNKCCFFDDCAHPALALQNKFSLNISLENDRLLLLTGYGNQNNGSCHDLHSDGDTTDTDNSYATADEGYDVSTFNIHAHGELAFCLCSSYQAKTILKICDQINVTHFDGI